MAKALFRREHRRMVRILSASSKRSFRTSLTALVLISLSSGSSGCSNNEGFVCQVENVEFVGVDRNDGADNLEKSGNPGVFGGGDRIFPDRNHPIGSPQDDLHDRVIVRATLSSEVPLGKSFVIHFRLFDEDHYSADPGFDPNGISAGDDNVKAGEPLGFANGSGAQLMDSGFGAKSTSVILTHNLFSESPPKVAELGLKLTDLQPGNNWKVAASCQGEVAEVEGVVVVPPPPEDWTEAKRTPLLTVWRHLHVEIDRMGDPVSIRVRVGRSLILVLPSKQVRTRFG